jgi:D-glycero-D-manno-heptose 1,7-bisphosphate phosphatase
LHRALFLDRDGVINEDQGYVHRIDDCRFLPGIFELAAEFSRCGFLLVVASNQSGIGRGLFTEDDYRRLTAWIEEQFRERDAPIAATYFCPDHPTEGVGAYRRESFFRKPAPGMLLQAARDLDIDLGASWAIGDKQRDTQAAFAAGIGTVVELDPTASEVVGRGGLWVVPRLSEAVALLKAEEG